MNNDQWKAMIVGAVNNPDDAQLSSLARHLAECEEAKTILRHKGYGVTGQSITDAVKLVGEAR